MTSIAACGFRARGLARSGGEKVAPEARRRARVSLVRASAPVVCAHPHRGSGLGSPRHGTHAQTQVFREAKSSKLVYYAPPYQGKGPLTRAGPSTWSQVSRRGGWDEGGAGRPPGEMRTRTSITPYRGSRSTCHTSANIVCFRWVLSKHRKGDHPERVPARHTSANTAVRVRSEREYKELSARCSRRRRGVGRGVLTGTVARHRRKAFPESIPFALI